jgi:1,4-dihydroxy-2-naphthoate octaprenyltransferase
MDRDTESIGGLQFPPKPDKNLFWLTIIMDAIAIGWAWILNPIFALMVLAYILASRAYSWRGIRLKKYPIGGFITVFVFQGAWTLAMVFCGVNPEFPLLFIPPLPMIVSSCLIGAVYPLTQIYQHEQDRNDGVKTLSMLLGFKGTFVFSGIFFLVANSCLFFFLRNLDLMEYYLRFVVCSLPVVVFFLGWARKVWLDSNQANYRYTMLMNLISAIFLNISFISMLA